MPCLNIQNEIKNSSRDSKFYLSFKNFLSFSCLIHSNYMPQTPQPSPFHNCYYNRSFIGLPHFLVSSVSPNPLPSYCFLHLIQKLFLSHILNTNISSSVMDCINMTSMSYWYHFQKHNKLNFTFMTISKLALS